MAILKPIINEFYIREKSLADKVFLKQPFGDDWKTITWREVGEQARKLVTALHNMGLKKGDHIALSSKNCYHWIIADIGLMMGGFVSVPLYPNLNSEELSTVLGISDAKLIIVGKLDEWDHMSTGIPSEMPIIHFPHYEGNAKVTRGKNWDDVISNVEPMEGDPLPELTDLWTILFTSGTTGTPKGVMIDGNILSSLLENERASNDMGIFTVENPVHFSFLPLNHIAERVLVEITAIVTGGTISFAESQDSFVKNLQDTEPTLFFAVPRIWTKFQQGVFAKMDPNKLNKLLKIPILSSIVKKKIRKGLGLTKAQIVLTAAAPTPDALKIWFMNLGIQLREVYGMTETCGGVTIMPKGKNTLGTIGKPLTNCLVKIDPETGEIITKSDWNMIGYYKEPEKTKEILKDGWIHTGDKGVEVENGFYKIVGRVTDTFKTTKGKYIMPVPLEDKLSNNEYIEQICVVGLGLNQPMALVNLSENGKKADKSEVTASLAAHLAAINDKLDSYKKISSFVITKDEWTIDNKIITPTLKVRRGFIHEKYSGQYDAWSDSKEKVIWE